LQAPQILPPLRTVVAREPSTFGNLQQLDNAMSTATLSTPLFERIHDALSTNPFVPSRHIQIETNDGKVVLKGQVRSFFHKQMAQEAIRRVDGVQTIDNLLEVNWA
jgi:osmotically-inducible protein OsmY